MAPHTQLHFIVFPFMAQGHMIPMIDIAKLLAKHGVLITIITTPINANRFIQVLDLAVESGLPINLVELTYPTQEAGLPQGCENLDMLDSLGLAREFYLSLNLLQKPVETLLQEMKPKPNCIISDVNLPYTSHVATNLHLPIIAFNGICCFSNLCMDRIYNSGLLQSVTSDSEYFSIPDLPHPIQLTKQQLPGAAVRNFGDIGVQMKAAEDATYGIIMNSFEELEPEYVQQCQKIREGYKVWCIGPVSLTNKHSLDLIQRGDKAPNQEPDRCLKWLDEQQPGSVLYACFGSLCNLVTPQLIELALGLEESEKPFVWVIRKGEQSRELEKWIEEEHFEERTKGRGLIIRGWAPQLVILSHRAIGGFFTHCGWNSILEAISVGVPMVTWPLFADHFCNEKLVVDVLKIGVKVGSEVTVVWGEEEKTGGSVKREDVRMAVVKLMEAGEESEEMRKRVEELSVKAKKAIEPNGSSCLNLKCLIEDIRILSENQANV